MAEDIQSKEIRGVNLKIVGAMIGVVATGVFLYAELRSQTIQNREILLEMRDESARYREKRDTEMKLQELQLREMNVRMMFIEKELKK